MSISAEAGGLPFASLFDLDPVATVISDRHGVVAAANRAARDLLAGGAEALLGLPLRDLVSEADTDFGAARPCLCRRRDGTQLAATVRRSRIDVGDGSAWLVLRIEPADQGDGLGSMVTDVTQRPALTDARTRALMQAKEDADLDSRTKDEFIASVSHEMRTPLHAIKSYTRLLNACLVDGSKGSPDKIAGYLRRIDASIVRLAHFVESILGISAYRSGRFLPLCSTVDLREAVHAAVRVVLPILEEKSQRVQVVPGTSALHVEADPTMVEQVVTNLLTNASRYSPDSSLVVVEIDADERPADPALPSACARVSVFDQGVGIPEDEIDSIFERFHQSARTRRGVGGTGLGLAICREIMTLHGGGIRASNNPGGGARFDVWFPLRQVALSPEMHGETD